MNRFENLFPDTYFDDRFFNQSERKKSIELEAEWLRAFGINFTGSVCDVGCSTGEFLEYTKWSGSNYGMEVNPDAMQAAPKEGIKFNKNILNSTSYFDVVIMRGVIQHLDQPYKYIEQAQNSLKTGGYLVFLQTPNIGCIYYRLFQNLPALETQNTYFLPDHEQLVRICERSGFGLVGAQKPYWKSPYASPLKDFSKFFFRLFFRSRSLQGPFPGNMMNLIFKKEEK